MREDREAAEAAVAAVVHSAVVVVPWWVRLTGPRMTEVRL